MSYKDRSLKKTSNDILGDGLEGVQRLFSRKQRGLHSYTYPLKSINA